MKSFKQFISQKRVLAEAEEKEREKNWKQEFINLDPGFKPHSNMRHVIQAFLDSGSIELTNDTSKKVTMPKKALYLVGGAVRDIVRGERPKDFDMATNATPEQIAMILHNAGFKVPTRNDESGRPMPDYDRSGKHDAADVAKAKEMKISFKPALQEDGDEKIWYLKGRDASADNKPFVIGAVVNGEEFEIATFRKDAKTVNGQSEVNFVDNPLEDAERRDFTMNAMYIELSKAEGENKRLYDPTKKGYADANEGRIRAVGKADKRFEEDGLRVMRAIRFHSKYGSEKTMDPELAAAIPKFAELRGIALERVREEFLKGLDDKNIDPAKYVRTYSRFGLLSRVFPGVSVRDSVPTQLKNKRDRFLAIAWMLQDNPNEKVREVLAGTRRSPDGEVHTGWSNQERDIVCYLLKLKEFDRDELDELLKGRRMLGVTPEQIRKWVEMFDVVKGGTVASPRPMWASHVKQFADFEPDQRQLVAWHAKDGEGKSTGEVHPEILRRKMHDVPPNFRGSVVKDINRQRLRDMFDSQGAF
jgi:tRNA nucleotidyltransferase/poly(A) polymerase